MSEWLENNKTKNKVFEEAQHKKNQISQGDEQAY